jgi:hypothetical protein
MDTPAPQAKDISPRQAGREPGDVEVAKAYKIPKKIAGVKVPRALRKSKLIRSFLKDPDNRQMINSALVAAGGAIATALAEHRAGGKHVKQALHGAEELGSDAAHKAYSATSVIGDAVAGAAHSLASTIAPSKDKKRERFGDDADSTGPLSKH